MNRKERRSHLKELSFMHTKAFEKDKLKETVLSDWSIQFELEWFASTIDKDYDWDIIDPKGIDSTRYMANPILKRGHKRGEENNIGLVNSIEVVEGTGYYIRWMVIQNPTIESHKEIIHGLRHWLINGFSIGFAVAKDGFESMEDWGLKINRLELHEISLVDIPNNPMTVRKFVEETYHTLSNDTNTMTKKDIIGKKSLRQLLTEAVENHKSIERWIYICDIYTDEFVYNQRGDDVAWVYYDKYYTVSYEFADDSVSLWGDHKEVEPATAWIEATKSLEGKVQEKTIEEEETTEEVEEEKTVAEDPAEVEIEETVEVKEEETTEEDATDEVEQVADEEIKEDTVEEEIVEEVAEEVVEEKATEEVVEDVPADAESAEAEKSVQEGVDVEALQARVKELEAEQAESAELMEGAVETIKKLEAMVEQASETYEQFGKSAQQSEKATDGFVAFKTTHGDFRDLKGS